MLENLKIIHEQMKDQYDLLILKMNVINQENFSLKRELYFYQNNNTNNTNNINTTSNYNSNNNTQNINNNKIINNNYNNENPEKNVNININMNNIPKQKINSMKINIDNNNNNQINYKKINNYKSEKNDKKEINNKTIEINRDKENDDVYNNTITKSHRKFIKNINQNDSSGVSALLKNNNYENITMTKIKRKEKERDKTPINRNIKLNHHDNNNYIYNNINNDTYRNINKINNNKKGKISRTKSIDNITNEDSNYINIKKKNNEISFYPSESNLKIEKKIEEIGKILIQLQKKRDIYLDEYDKLPENPKKQKELLEKRDIKKIIDELNSAINGYKMKERNLKKMYNPI